VIKRPIRVVPKTLNTLVKAIPHGRSVIEDRAVADRKFLQETNFDEDVDLDEAKENEFWRRRLQQQERQRQSTQDQWSNQ